MAGSMPVPFAGTEEERQANYASHRFVGSDPECMNCPTKPWHVAASYPCGVEPPRAEIPDGDEAKAIREQIIRAASFAIEYERPDR